MTEDTLIEKRNRAKEAAVEKCRQKALFFTLSLFLALCCMVALIGSEAAYARKVPPLKGYVNDYADMISREARVQLEQELRDFESSDTTQIVILTVESLDGDVLENFSISVAEAWKIGQRGRDNGVILLVAEKERKTRIEVGRGLEGKLTDLTAGRIVQLVVNPQFKRGDFDAGFKSGVRAIIDATRGEFRADAAKGPPSSGDADSPFMPIMVYGSIVLLILSGIARPLGIIAGTFGFPVAGWLLGAAMPMLIVLGVLGFVMGMFLPLIFSGATRGKGVYSHGGWGAGGGFSGGGFGGGGGGFGGGGASGDW